MSAPTPATGDGSPTPGYYPDPSIPGYVRYWNGAAWVPGTSRPAPHTGDATPAPPHPASGAPAASAPAQSQAPSSVEETGPVFFDEEPDDEPSRPEPATAWGADTSRQTGFGGDRDNRVSWGGGGQDPRTSAAQNPAAQNPAAQNPAAGAPADPRADPRRPAVPAQSGDPTGGALPGVRSLGPSAGGEPPADGTVAIRALRPQAGKPSSAGTGAGEGTGTGSAGSAAPAGGTPAGSGPQPPVDSTVTIRALRPGGGAPTGQADGTMSVRSMTPGAPGATAQPQAPAQPDLHAPAQPWQPQPEAQSQAPAQPQSWQPQSETPAQPQPETPAQPQPQQPVSDGTGGGSASWAQQVHRLAGTTDPEPPVVPWKPPVDDPFLQAAQAQAAARPASLGKRLAARLIDTLLLGALVGAAAVPVISRARTHVDEKIEAAKQSGETVTVWLVDSTTAVHLGIVLGALLILGVLYEALPTAKWGRTLGKKLCGLSVWDIESHEPPSFGAALRRWLLYSVFGVLAIGVLNVLWCLFDRPWRQCWHDKAAHTFVTG